MVDSIVGTYADRTPLGAAFSGTKSKVMRDDPASWGDRYSKASQQAYNNYNELLGLMNQDRSTGDYLGGDSATGITSIKKTSPFKNKTKHYTSYGLGSQSGNYALDQYAKDLLGGYSGGASSWADQQRNAYQKSLDAQAKSLYGEYLDPYKTNQLQSTETANQTAYDQAKAKLDQQRTYGYLSDVGYQNALTKLNNETARVKQSMGSVYEAQVSDWEKALQQAYSSQVTPEAWSFSDYAGNAGADQEWLDYSNWAKNYGAANIGQEYLDSLMANADSYNPDLYIAYGAGTQGEYNPYLDFTVGQKRKKKDVSTTGINEV